MYFDVERPCGKSVEASTTKVYNVAGIQFGNNYNYSYKHNKHNCIVALLNQSTVN